MAQPLTVSPMDRSGFKTTRLLADGAPDVTHIYDFSMIMIGFCAIMTVIMLIFVIRRALDRQAGEIGGWEMRGAWGRVRAVARNTLAEGLRTKLASGFAAIILAAIPAFWLTSSGDGTIKGQIQMFLAYSIGFTGFMLSLLTIFFSCRSLSVEVASRQIYAIVSKPVPRWQIVAGKMLGVMILNIALVAVAMVAIHIGVMATLSRFKTKLTNELVTYGSLTQPQAEIAVAALDNVKGMGAKGLDSPVIPMLSESLGWSEQKVADMLLALPEETRVNLRRFDELRRQVLVGRATVMPEEPDLGPDVEREYKRREEADVFPADHSPAEIRKQIRNELSRAFRTVRPFEDRRWVLKGPKPEIGRDFLMSIRFKISPSHYMEAKSIDMQDGTMLNLEEDTFLTVWALGDPTTSIFLSTPPVAHPASAFNEFEIPGQAVYPDGTVVVTFGNIDPRRADAVFDFPYGLQILYRVGPFELSLLQAAVAMLIPLTCLAAFGVCASTFLSFPVAALIVITLFIIASSMGFIAESLGTTKDYYDPDNMTTDLIIRQKVVAGIGWLLAIGDVDYVSNVIEGRALGWDTIWSNVWKFVLIKCSVVLLLAVMIFRRRELATVIVS